MANWKKIIVSGSDAELRSLYVSGTITGSGAGLYNIPASSITGLQLFQITSGSVSASVDTNGNIFTVTSGSDNILTLDDAGTLSLSGNLNLTDASSISSTGDLGIETLGGITIIPQGKVLLNGSGEVEIRAPEVQLGTYGSNGIINIYGQLDIQGEPETILDLDTNSVVYLRDSIMSLSGSSKIQIQSSASLPNDVVTVKDLGLSSIFANTGSYQATTNDLQVTGSLIVTDGIIGSFTGSYSGSIYLKQDTILLGDATDNASQVLTEPIQLDNVGSTPLTETFLVANYSAYTNSKGDTVSTKVGQTVESTWQLAIKTAAGWDINKKNENHKIEVPVDITDSNIWNAQLGLLDLTDFQGLDIVRIEGTFSNLTVTNISIANPAIITFNDISSLQNDDLIDINSVQGGSTITSLNSGIYMVKNINYAAKTAALYTSTGAATIETTQNSTAVTTIIQAEPGTVMVNDASAFNEGELIVFLGIPELEGSVYQIQGLAGNQFDLHTAEGMPVNTMGITYGGGGTMLSAPYYGGGTAAYSGDRILRIDKILGIPDHYEIIILPADGFELEMDIANISTATTNQIVRKTHGGGGAGSGTITLIGRSTVSDRVTVFRDKTLNVVMGEPYKF